jgi:uncharacterized protein (TIGR03083 family)
MISSTINVEAIPGIDHEEAMRLAHGEYATLLLLVDDLSSDEWSRPTDCTGWDVRAMVAHMIGMLELQASADERARQLTTAAEVAARTGCLRLDAMTALQVRERDGLGVDELRRALHDAAPRGLAARQAITPARLAAPYDPQIPGETNWTFGYLFDVIHTRDPWIHRVDICRAVGRDLTLTADHDGRIVADVVADWARRHGQPVTLTLAGPAGGRFTRGERGVELELDAVEFCRILSGRAQGPGLLATPVPF